MKEKSRLRVWFNSLSLRVMAGTIFLTLTAALFIGALAGMFIRRQLKDQLAAQSRQQAEYLMRTVDIGVIAPLLLGNFPPAGQCPLRHQPPGSACR